MSQQYRSSPWCRGDDGTKRARRGAVLLLAGLIVGVCATGCGSTRAKRGFSRAQFIASADSVCRLEQAKLAFISQRARRLGHALAAPSVIRQQVAQSQLATARLEALPRPPADVRTIDRWLTARTVAATVALDLAEAPARGDAVAVRDVNGELAKTRARARDLALRYGSRVCDETD
jgi:hypothetical protein